MILAFAGRVLGFFRSWIQLHKTLTGSFQLRKESRYALAMMAWLEMEAERCDTLQELWTSYLFLSRKLGFASLRLVLDRGTEFVWKSHSPAPLNQTWRRARHDLHLANVRGIEFGADASAMSQDVFEHLTELACEAWMKAAQRWSRTSGHAIRFEPAYPQTEVLIAPGRVLVANAT